MTDKTHEPTESEIHTFISENVRKTWIVLKQFIEEAYGLVSGKIFYGAKYGWTVRYRKSGKTLCSLFPEEGKFIVLIVLGCEEALKTLPMERELSPQTLRLIENTKQLHDGCWLWIRITEPDDIDDSKTLLQLKRKPEKANLNG
jgi:hypothetical protein